MSVALALFLGAASVSWLLPRVLMRLSVTALAPGLLICGWMVAAVSVLVALFSVVIALLTPSHGIPGQLAAAVNDCWVSMRHGVSPRAEVLSGLLGALVVTAAVVRGGFVAVRLVRRRARARRERLAVLRLAGRTEPGFPTTLWLAHDRPLAFSLPGRPGYVVATDGLARHLSPIQQHAVLAHERAHLRGRHHTLLGFVDTLAEVLGVLPLYRAAPAALRELIELAADDVASRLYGVDALRAALIRVADGPTPGSSLAFGQDAIAARIERLTQHTQPAGALARRGVACGLAGVLAALPFSAAAASFAAISALFC